MLRLLATSGIAAILLLGSTETATAQQPGESPFAARRSARVFNPFASRPTVRTAGWFNLFRRVEAPVSTFETSAAPETSEATTTSPLTLAPVALSARPNYRPPVRSPYRPPPRPPF